MVVIFILGEPIRMQLGAGQDKTLIKILEGVDDEYVSLLCSTKIGSPLARLTFIVNRDRRFYFNANLNSNFLKVESLDV